MFIAILVLAIWLLLGTLVVLVLRERKVLEQAYFLTEEIETLEEEKNTAWELYHDVCSSNKLNTQQLDNAYLCLETVLAEPMTFVTLFQTTESDSTCSKEQSFSVWEPLEDSP